MKEKQKMIDSFIRNRKGILFMICSASCACVGQLLWKLSTEQGILLSFIGFLFYGLGALFMIIAYKFGSLSVLQPMQSVNYVFSIIIGVLVLQEAVTSKKLVGVFIIMLGIVLIGGGDEE